MITASVSRTSVHSTVVVRRRLGVTLTLSSCTDGDGGNARVPCRRGWSGVARRSVGSSTLGGTAVAPAGGSLSPEAAGAGAGGSGAGGAGGTYDDHSGGTAGAGRSGNGGGRGG